MKTLTSKDPEFLEFVGKQESQYLMTKDYWRDDVKDFFAGNVVQLGDFLPWDKTSTIVRLRPGEVSIWAGINGHGKSMVSGQVALWLSRMTKVLIASLEMKPSSTLARMIRQASGGNQPPQAYIDKFFDWSKDNMWIYDQLDSVDTDRILGMLHYAAQKLGIKHVFIDSLMKCGIGTDDYNKQKDFVDRLCWVAKSENIHIHLIHHVRKGGSERERPGKFDIKGAGEITDLVDNVFIQWRNKGKEEKVKMREAGQSVDLDDDEADAILTVAKQRHGEWEGPLKLWFHAPSQQFIPKPCNSPMPFSLESA